MRRCLDFAQRWPALLLAGAMSAIYLVVLVPAQDFASGSFRATLSASGARLWNNMWFGGHPLPAYGILSAWLSGVFGVRVVAAMSVVIATWGFIVVARRSNVASTQQIAAASTLFAACVGMNMWAGRLTFAPSIAFGVLALVALSTDHRLSGCVAAASCALSSPVGGVFLLLILVALWWNHWKRAAIVTTAMSCAIPLAVVLLFFSEGGWFPFRWQNLFMVTLNLAIIGWIARSHRYIVSTLALYSTLVLFAFLVRSPLGGNVVRLAWLTSGALSLLFLPERKKVLALGACVLSLAWNAVYLPIGRSLDVAAAKSSFYEPVAEYLASVPGVHKVEVVSTNVRRESELLALDFPIARGWQTQIDRERNPIFYSDRLTSSSYADWLRDNAVSFVVVPRRDVHRDSIAEAHLASSMRGELVQSFESTNWVVYKVLNPTPLASNGSEVLSVTAEQIRVRVSSPGWTVLRFRFTTLYEVDEGDACVTSTKDGWIRLYARASGDITLVVHLTVGGLLHRVSRCG